MEKVEPYLHVVWEIFEIREGLLKEPTSWKYHWAPFDESYDTEEEALADILEKDIGGEFVVLKKVSVRNW